MHLYYCAGINSQSFAGAGGSGHAHCGSGRECNTHVAGAGGNGQKISGSGQERDEENGPAQVSRCWHWQQVYRAAGLAEVRS